MNCTLCEHHIKLDILSSWQMKVILLLLGGLRVVAKWHKCICWKNISGRKIFDRLPSIIHIKKYLLCWLGVPIDHLNKDTNLNAKSAQLIFAVDQYFAKENIKKSSDSSALALLNRYMSAGIVYGVANGLPRHWCEVMEKVLIAPDLTIFLDKDLSLAQTRLRKRKRERYDNLHF